MKNCFICSFTVGVKGWTLQTAMMQTTMSVVSVAAAVVMQEVAQYLQNTYIIIFIIFISITIRITI